MARKPKSAVIEVGEAVTELTDHFFESAVKRIDKSFGKGAAKDNPELVVAYLSASSNCFDALATTALGAPNELDAYDLEDIMNAMEQEKN